MNFRMIILNQNIKKMLNYVIWSFIIHTKTEDFYKDIADNVEKRFETSNNEVGRPLLKGRNKTVIGIMKDDYERSWVKWCSVKWIRLRQLFKVSR